VVKDLITKWLNRDKRRQQTQLEAFKARCELVDAYRMVFVDTKSGEKVLDDLVDFAGLAQSSHVPNDPTTTAFAEGCKRTVLYILERLNERPEPPKEA